MTDHPQTILVIRLYYSQYLVVKFILYHVTRFEPMTAAHFGGCHWFKSRHVV